MDNRDMQDGETFVQNAAKTCMFLAVVCKAAPASYICMGKRYEALIIGLSRHSRVSLVSRL
eukprot:4602513-Amphidinium_carterae.1